ncbi:MAG TPA: 3-phosphoshikimate 1-carboxyvinyltransferase [Candidatus Binatia bacterium]|nr:3-phosphoshikimate 1-carboxyvinyltransferase [Candidatus Binatia bacterium]
MIEPTRSVEVRVPGDKSITHRALILAALAHGESRIAGGLDSADTRATAGVLHALGTRMRRDDAGVMVAGRGLQHLSSADGVLDCGNSGTTARLMLGVLAGQRFRSTLDGDASLRGRPMRRVTDPLAAMGARFEELGEPDRLPVAVDGARLQPIDHSSARASAQVKSSLLLAALTGGCSVSIEEPMQSRDHTERLLAALGVPIEVSGTAPHRVRIEPIASLPPFDITVPGDISSASFLVALGLLVPGLEIRIPGVGVNPTRTGFLDAVGRMGGSVAVETATGAGGEPVANLSVRSADTLRAVDVTAADVPPMIDELPVLAVLAARAEGESRITGAAELRVKESDRIAALVTNLRAVGLEAHELEDGLVVTGTDRPLEGRVDAGGDHRIAMAFGILAALPGNRITIDDPAAVGVSFPAFWQVLAHCAGTDPRT